VGQGTPEIRARIQKNIEADGRIEFLGEKYGREKDAILRQADLLVFPSRYHEGQPMVFLDAIKYNIPLITTDVGGARSLFASEVTYIPSGDTKDIYEALHECIFSRKWPDYEYSEARDRTDIRKIVDQYQKILSDI